MKEIIKTGIKNHQRQNNETENLLFEKNQQNWQALSYLNRKKERKPKSLESEERKQSYRGMLVLIMSFV